MDLKYGCNPHQHHASVEPLDPDAVPIRVLNGTPSFINFLDALNAWQLVREARAALDLRVEVDAQPVAETKVSLLHPRRRLRRRGIVFPEPKGVVLRIEAHDEMAKPRYGGLGNHHFAAQRFDLGGIFDH
ncbi:MAG: hypothetical protein ACC662_09455, partial [Planctomycetota bacterium]